MGRAKRYIGTRRGNSKTARTYPSQTLSIRFENDIKAQLEAFVGRLNDEVFRPAAFAAVTVLYDEMRVRVSYEKGDLFDAIYRWRVKEDIGNQAIFYAGVNKRKAPHWWLVEHGHWQYYRVIKPDDGPYAGQYVTLKDQPLAQPKFVPAKPYIRPAVDKLPQAMQEAMRVLKLRLRGVMRNQIPLNDLEYY